MDLNVPSLVPWRRVIRLVAPHPPLPACLTPFRQMSSFVDALERREVAAINKPVRIGMKEAVKIGGREFDAVTVAQGYEDEAKESDGLTLVPLRSPLAASGFTPAALKL